jgi:hypothetical protein
MYPPPSESRSSALLCGALILLIVPLMGCTLGATKPAATPPAPKPAAVQPPAPDPPLSIPQTAVTLPSLQEVNPAAIPAAPVPQEVPAPEKTEAPAPVKTSRRTAVGPKPDPEQETETAAPPTPAAPEQAPIQPLLSDEDQRKIKGSIEARTREINDKLGRAKSHLTNHDKPLIDRIQSFLAQCAQAERRGDYTQADALSERALVLARELQVE